MKNYIEQALRTKSDKFYGDSVPLVDFKLCLGECIAALQNLDHMKKALFYGRAYDGAEGATYGPNVNTVSHLLAGSLNVDLQPTKHPVETLPKAIDVIHSIIGKATEAGELLEHLLDVANEEKAFDLVNFKEEIADGLWYDAIGLAAVGATFDEVQQTNIAKLRARFPEKFTEQNANVRDLDAERKILEL